MSRERGMIFSAPMVKALLDGSKTQTRRIVKDKRLSPKVTLLELLDFLGGGGTCDNSESDGLRVSLVNDYDRKDDAGHIHQYTGLLVQSEAVPEDGAEEITCPYGVAGDRLWFKENYTVLRFEKERGLINHRYIYYRLVGRYAADQKLFSILLDHRESKLFAKRKRKLGGQSGRFMYRSLARIIRDLTGVRVERLQDISAFDVIAEGIEYWKHKCGCEYCAMHAGEICPATSSSLVMEYAELWDSLHGKGAWELNPWVWGLEFNLCS